MKEKATKYTIKLSMEGMEKQGQDVCDNKICLRLGSGDISGSAGITGKTRKSVSVGGGGSAERGPLRSVG